MGMPAPAVAHTSPASTVVRAVGGASTIAKRRGHAASTRRRRRAHATAVATSTASEQSAGSTAGGVQALPSATDSVPLDAGLMRHTAASSGSPGGPVSVTKEAMR